MGLANHSRCIEKGEGMIIVGTGGFDIKVTWLKTSESALKTPVLSSVLKYRDLESHGSSKVTQAAQGTVASPKSLSKCK